MTKVREVWKDMPGFEGFIQVSTLGRLKRLQRYRTCLGRKMILRERIIRQDTYPIGYSRVTFSVNGKKFSSCAHIAIARTFIPNPENKPFVNHINGIKTDNSLNNLEWCTPLENIHHAMRTGLWDARGEKCGKSILNNKQVLRIRKLYGDGLRFTEIRDRINGICSKDNVRDICIRETWKHI